MENFNTDTAAYSQPETECIIRRCSIGELVHDIKIMADMEPGHVSVPETWYIERYAKSETNIYALYEDGIFVAYLISAPVSRQLYHALSDGLFDSDYGIRNENFKEVQDGLGKVYRFIPELMVRKDCRISGYATALLRACINSEPMDHSRHVALCTKTSEQIFKNAGFIVREYKGRTRVAVREEHLFTDWC